MRDNVLFPFFHSTFPVRSLRKLVNHRSPHDFHNCSSISSCDYSCRLSDNLHHTISWNLHSILPCVQPCVLVAIFRCIINFTPFVPHISDRRRTNQMFFTSSGTNNWSPSSLIRTFSPRPSRYWHIPCFPLYVFGTQYFTSFCPLTGWLIGWSYSFIAHK